MGVSLVPSHARWSLPAGSTSLQQFQFCEINSSGQIVTPTVSGVFAVVLDDAPSNAVATLGANGTYSGGYTVGRQYGVVLGMCVMKVITGANLGAGVAVQTDTNGHAVPLVTGGVTLGYTLQASNSGDIVGIRLV